MLLRSFVATACVLVGCFSAAPASAHFKLLKPASWLKEDSTGGPQKGSPCGPGNSGFLGDDVQPVPMSGMVTEFKAGDMVEIELDETIPHPGYFRVAIAKDRSELTIPPVDDAMSCALDLSKVATGAHDNILADGLWKEDSQPSARHLTTMVKLPNEPCEKCTIQVVQVMKDHGLSSCYYYHCADIKIVAAGTPTGTAGTAAAAGSGGSTAAAGSSAGSSASAGAGAGGVSGSAAGTPAASTAGATAAGTSGAAGRASSAAGSVAAPSGSAGKPATTGAAGQGTTTSPSTTAGATAVAGGAAPAAPAESSGCSVAVARTRGVGARGAGAPGGLALLAVAFLVRVRRRRSLRAGRSDA